VIEWLCILSKRGRSRYRKKDGPQYEGKRHFEAIDLHRPFPIVVKLGQTSNKVRCIACKIAKIPPDSRQFHVFESAMILGGRANTGVR
jgi:hypothetical protein